MKISVNDQELFTLSEVQIQVLKNDILADVFDEDMKRRLHWALDSKYQDCFKRLKSEWDTKLAQNGVDMMPTCPDAYAQLVFAQPNYKDRTAREAIEILPE